MMHGPGASPASPGVLLQAQRLGFAYAGHPVLQGLDFGLRPGLSLLRGGEGRGKTTLLRLIAGELLPSAGQLLRPAAALQVSHERPQEAEHDPVLARAWLAARQARFAPSWEPGLAQALLADFQLAEHLDKPLYMLSTGSRRKIGLVAAAASGAGLTLLDTPYAALDARSSRRLTALLAQAAGDTRRAWVLADYALPAGLSEQALAACVELGE